MESPFPVNCLYDPAELLTVQQNKSVLFIRPMDIYKKLTGFDNDPTWWFEYLGFLNLNFQPGYDNVATYEGDGFLLAPILLWGNDLRLTVIGEPDDDKRYDNVIDMMGQGLPRSSWAFSSQDKMEPFDTLIMTNYLGYHDDAEDVLFELINRHRSKLKQIYVNFPFALYKTPTWYRGRRVNPYTYERLERLLKRFARNGYHFVGDMDFENVDLRDPRNLPDASVAVSRGRLLLECTIPF